MRRALAVALVLIAAALAGRGVASAQSGIEVRSNTAQSDFPNGISFQLGASATGEVVGCLPWWLKLGVGVLIAVSGVCAIIVMPEEEEKKEDD